MIDVYFHVDYGSSIGMGHFMRSLSFLESLNLYGINCKYFINKKNEFVESNLIERGVKFFYLNNDVGDLREINEIIEWIKDVDDVWIILDGYCFNSDYQKKLSKHMKTILFDDYNHLQEYDVDFLINSNIYADKLRYNVKPYVNMILGPKYYPFRAEFEEAWSYRKLINSDINNILITLGATDPNNVIIDVIKNMEGYLVDKNVKIVIGMNNLNKCDIINYIIKNGVNYEVMEYSNNMSELMLWADIAITSGGVTASECALMGVPTLLLCIAENQKLVVKYMDKYNIAIDITQKLNNKKNLENALKKIMKLEVRKKMSIRGKYYFDPYGVKRIISKLMKHKIWLKNVDYDDVDYVFNLSNDMLVRNNSYNSNPIIYEDHKSWFYNKIEDDNCLFYIIMDDQNNKIGQVRFQLNGDEAEISISIHKFFRGKGYGVKSIILSTNYIMSNTNINTIVAKIKETNIQSIKAFKKAGYKLYRKYEINNITSKELHYGRDKH